MINEITLLYSTAAELVEDLEISVEELVQALLPQYYDELALLIQDKLEEVEDEDV